MEQFVLGHLEVVAADKKWDKEGLDVSLLLCSPLLGVRWQSSPQSLQISGQIVK